jgi:hypothetical protein
MRRHARSGTRDALSEFASLAPEAGSTKRDGPGDQTPHDVAHDTRPASAPDAEVPSGSGSGGGRADHDPNGMRTHVRLQEARGRSHKAGTFAPMFPGEATKAWRQNDIGRVVWAGLNPKSTGEREASRQRIAEQCPR